MLKNYFLITVRNLFKNKVYVIINVVGLGLALALCIVAYLNHGFAVQFDRNHKNINEIYKVNVTKEVNGNETPYGITPLSLGAAIDGDIPFAEQISRFTFGRGVIKYQDNVFDVSIGYGDDDYLEMFTFPLISGSKADLSDPSKIFLTQATAIRFFGKENAVGKSVTLISNSGKSFDYTVAGVMEDIPLNTSMKFEALTNFKSLLRTAGVEDELDWKRFIAATFLRIGDGSKVETVESLLKKHIPVQNKSREDWKITSFYLEPLTTVGFTGREMRAYWHWEAMHPAAIISPSIMALLILLIACFNFTNTSIAFSGKRLKEIGVRKVLGGRRSQLVWQFLGENMVLCFLALILGLFLAIFLVPGYSAMWEYLDIELNFSENLGFYFFLAGLLIFTGFLAGVYPAFYVSGFQPVKILNNSLKIKGSGILSRILLTAQFTISIITLVCGIVFTQNAAFQKGLDLGYEKEEIIAVPTNNDSESTAFKNAVRGHTKIKSLASTSEHIGWSDYQRAIKDEKGSEMEVNVLRVGLNYINTMNMHLLAGRDFDADREQNDIQESVIVNKLLAERYNWENAVGKKIIVADTIHLKVVGVLDNFYLDDFFDPIEPTIFRLSDPSNTDMVIAQVGKADLKDMNRYFEATWKQVNPYAPYRGFYQEDRLAQAKSINSNIMYMFLFLSLMAVILSAIGLFTLVSMNILSRVKELGIRKVMGASIANLAGIINKQFIIILLIASVLGVVSGYYLTDMLMGSIYAVYVEMNVASLLVPVVMTFIFAVFTIGGKVYRAAARNPVDSLRHE